MCCFTVTNPTNRSTPVKTLTPCSPSSVEAPPSPSRSLPPAPLGQFSCAPARRSSGPAPSSSSASHPAQARMSSKVICVVPSLCSSRTSFDMHCRNGFASCAASLMLTAVGASTGRHLLACWMADCHRDELLMRCTCWGQDPRPRPASSPDRRTLGGPRDSRVHRGHCASPWPPPAAEAQTPLLARALASGWQGPPSRKGHVRCPGRMLLGPERREKGSRGSGEARAETRSHRSVLQQEEADCLALAAAAAAAVAAAEGGHGARGPSVAPSRGWTSLRKAAFHSPCSSPRWSCVDTFGPCA